MRLIYNNYILENATALGERRRVLRRRFPIAQFHSAGYVCALLVNVIGLNFNELVTFARCARGPPGQEQIDVRLNIYINRHGNAVDLTRGSLRSE